MNMCTCGVPRAEHYVIGNQLRRFLRMDEESIQRRKDTGYPVYDCEANRWLFELAPVSCGPAVPKKPHIRCSSREEVNDAESMLLEDDDETVEE